MVDEHPHVDLKILRLDENNSHYYWANDWSLYNIKEY